MSIRSTRRSQKNSTNDNLKHQAKWFNLKDYDTCKDFNLPEWAINITMRRQTTFFMQTLNKEQKSKGMSETQIKRFLKIIWEQFLNDRKKLLSEEGLKKALKNGCIAYNQMNSVFLAMPPTNEVIRFFYAGIARKTLFISFIKKVHAIDNQSCFDIYDAKPQNFKKWINYAYKDQLTSPMEDNALESWLSEHEVAMVYPEKDYKTNIVTWNINPLNPTNKNFQDLEITALDVK